MKTSVLLIILFPIAVIAQPDEAVKNIRAGNEFYRVQEWDKAATAYEAALKNEPGNITAEYNLATVRAKQSNMPDAARLYKSVISRSAEPLVKSKSHYNQGVMLSKQDKLEQSIEAYKNALRIDPTDKQARENLQKALIEQKKRNPPPPKKDDKKQKQNKQQKQPQSKMSQKEAEQRLQLLEQKEKEIQQRRQKARAQGAGGGGKDW
jgi:tetratricopeptide (TPR) repeat protein